ncbi:MAG: glycosyltransferase family 2 protein [Candidatus Obscuribacterales bacterium]|nr:glycosyltransferase family 2 protein [Candidatus Obscuribacterales bacterium]
MVAEVEKTSVQLSVIIPVYRAQSFLHQLNNRLHQVLNELSLSYELLFVDDSSPDGSWDILAEIASSTKSVRAIKLSRNYGQQAAITAGLTYARGERAVIMDCDLQDLPEDIPRLIAKAEEGYDIVFAKRASRAKEPVRALVSQTYFNLLSAITGTKVDDSCGSFSIISRNVIDAFLRFTDHSRHYLLILFWLGFRRGYIDAQRAAREEGQSSYNFKTLLRLALQGLFFQSTALLEWIIGTGFAISFLGFLGIFYALGEFFICKTVLSGWTSTVVLTLTLGGFNLIAVGVVGLYIGQIFEQVKGRPLFVVQSQLNEPGNSN